MSRRILHSIGVCLSLSILCLPVRAQNEPPENRTALDLQAAITRTVANNPDLISAGYQIKIAEGSLQQAGLAPNPEFGVNVEDVLGSGEFNGMARSQTTLTLDWILERGKRQYRVDAARANVSLRSIEAEIVRLDVAAQTARQFIICLALQTRLINAAKAVNLSQKTLEAVRLQVAASRVPDADLARAEASLARAELLREDYQHELSSAYHQLAAQWGQTQLDFSSVAGTLEQLPVADSFETLLERAEANPELIRFASQQRLNESNLRLAQERAKPSWQLYTGLRRLETSDDVTIVGGIKIPLSIRNRNQGQISETRATIAQTNAETNAASIRIQTSLFVRYQELQHDLHIAERLVEDVIPLIERAVTGTQRAYELGRYSYTELSAVQAELLKANNDLLEVSVDAHQIIIEIERLTGVRFNAPVPTQ